MFDIQQKLFDRLFEAENGCLEYSGSRDTSGYGIVWKDGRNQGAHILAYKYYKDIDVIPDGMLICHTCDNPPCCVEEHLFMGTRQDNYDDMVAKGRNYIRKGTEVNTSQLNENDVRLIRQSLSRGQSANSLGNKFGVSKQAVLDIKHGRSWGWFE